MNRLRGEKKSSEGQKKIWQIENKCLSLQSQKKSWEIEVKIKFIENIVVRKGKR